MKFRLIYEGPIAPKKKGSLEAIHTIRKGFDPQLRNLWQFPPVSTEAAKWLKHPENNGLGQISIYETRGTTVFAPLVSKRADLQCELEITFLRKQAPGQLI